MRAVVILSLPSLSRILNILLSVGPVVPPCRTRSRPPLAADGHSVRRWRSCQCPACHPGIGFATGLPSRRIARTKSSSGIQSLTRPYFLMLTGTYPSLIMVLTARRTCCLMTSGISARKFNSPGRMPESLSAACAANQGGTEFLHGEMLNLANRSANLTKDAWPAPPLRLALQSPLAVQRVSVPARRRPSAA